MNRLSLTAGCAAVSAALVAGCSGNLSGPTTEEGNPVARGYVIDSAGGAVAGASVTLYKQAVARDSLTPPVPVVPLVTATTTRDGSYSLYALSAGVYTLEAVTPDSTGFAAATGIQIAGNRQLPVALDTLVVKTPGSIRGVVTRGGVMNPQTNTGLLDGFIQVGIVELGRYGMSNIDGVYEFGDVAEGIYTLVFHATGFFTAYLDSVQVYGAAAATTDTVTLARIPWTPPPKPFDLAVDFDSSARVVRLSWQSYATSDLIGFTGERRINPLVADTVFTTQEPWYVDTVSGFAPGTELYYVVRAVNERFMESANEGPVSVVIR